MQQFCTSNNWQFCFIGGIAVQRWAEPRFTEDVDITLLTGFENEESYISALLAEFQPRRVDAAAFALEYRVLLLRDPSGVGIDISLGGLPFEARVIARASPFAFDAHCVITVCSAEDLIVQKAFANRPQDWVDIETVLRRQHNNIDRIQVLEELLPLAELKEDEAIVSQLKKLFTRWP